jgi:hypothetical protein
MTSHGNWMTYLYMISSPWSGLALMKIVQGARKLKYWCHLLRTVAPNPPGSISGKQHVYPV